MPLPGEPLTARLAGLFVYPVKACAGLALEGAALEERGLADDRRWMVVEPGGRALTQRDDPRLALVRTRLADGLWLAAEGAGEVRVLAGSERAECAVWSSRVDLALARAPASRWLSEFLGRPVRLAHLDATAHRQVRAIAEGPAVEVSLADELPLLVAAVESLAALNARLARAVPMDRFRPNLVLEGAPAFAEDEWRRVALGAVELELQKPAGRCAVVCVDQARGERDPDGEPLRALAAFRRAPPRPQADPGGVYFGVRAAPVTTGALRRGDALRVLARW